MEVGYEDIHRIIDRLVFFYFFPHSRSKGING